MSNKALKILFSMTQAELKSFGKFLSSPYHNNSRQITRLYRFISQHHPDILPAGFSKQKAFEFVYESGAYNDSRLRKLFSDLYKLAEKFIVLQNLESKKAEYDRFLLEELDKRKLDSLYRNKFDDAVSDLENSGYHYQLFLNMHDLKWQNVAFHLSRGEQEKIINEIHERSEQITFYFLSDLFITMNDLKINKRDRRQDNAGNLPQVLISSIDLENVIRQIENSNIRHKEIFMLYYHAHLMNSKAEDRHFYDLKKLLDRNISKLSKAGKMNFVLMMLNYCNLRLNTAEDRKLEKAHLQLYDMLMTHGLYKSDNNYFRSDLFLNSILAFLKYRRLDKARQFLNDNAGHTNPDHRVNLEALCRAMLHFEEGRYGDSLEAASSIKTNLVFMKIILRKLLLKIGYEIHDLDTNRDALSNCRHFAVNSANINSQDRKKLLDFLSLYSIMLKAGSARDNGHLLKQMNERLTSFSRSADKHWFNQKIKELDGGR